MGDIDTSRPLTVLFHIQDPDRFDAFSQRLFESLSTGSEIEGAVVTGLSVQDEFARVEAFEEVGHV